MQTRSRRTPLFTFGVALLYAYSSSFAQPPAQQPPISTGLEVRSVDEVHPVPGTDNRIHLAYELQVINHSSLLVAIDRVEAFSESGEKLSEWSGRKLTEKIQISGGETGNTFGPSHSGYLVTDIALPASSRLPSRIRHRFTLTRQQRAGAKEDHAGVALPAGGPAGPNLTFEGAEVRVDPAPAIAIAPPLRGPGWFVGNGCCDDASPHRLALLVYDGTVYVPERFAVDILQLDRERRLYTGPIDRLDSYAYYGVPVYSVGEGTVVEVQDSLPDAKPGALPAGITPSTAAGNDVIVDLGSGHYAMYAHLQPGSIRVKAGDRTRQGDILGKLGNSGNTTNPHLHFQISDRPSLLFSRSLPFVFTEFTSPGVLTGLAPLFEAKPAVIDPKMAGKHVRQLPLNFSVVNFE